MRALRVIYMILRTPHSVFKFKKKCLFGYTLIDSTQVGSTVVTALGILNCLRKMSRISFHNGKVPTKYLKLIRL